MSKKSAENRETENKFEIEIKISDESELYCSLDPKRLTLNDDVIDYIFTRYKEKNEKGRLVIIVISDKPIDMDNLKKTFDKYLNEQSFILKRQKRTNMKKQLWMFGIGVFFIILGLAAGSHISLLTSEIISTIGAFSLWEAASIWIVENPYNRVKQKWIRIISHTELINKVLHDSE